MDATKPGDKGLGKFFYRGKISASKSLMNRALIVKSFYPDFAIQGGSVCEDVRLMQQASAAIAGPLKNGGEIQCGDAGTVLRFMALRASRETGVFRLKGSDRLFERPQEDLMFVLTQLGVRCEFLPRELVIESKGWKKPLVRLRIHREKSSQFSTGLLMSAWNLHFPLDFELTPAGLKDSYWQMTLELAGNLGMAFERKTMDHVIVRAQSHPTVNEYNAEPDFSSMFAICATAALAGEARIEGVNLPSLQPDSHFIDIMQAMKIPIMLEQGVLGVLKAPRILALDHSLRDTPDLFPVLAVLCAFAEGTSRLIGAPRLVFKESNRIKKTAELLKLMGVNSVVRPDGLEIEGKGLKQKMYPFEFDPDEDHRMAMAAGILLRVGWPVTIKHPQVVKKSFPEFWDILGLKV